MKGPSLVFRLALLQQALAAALIVIFSASAIALSMFTLERQEGAFLSRTAADLGAALEREWGEDHDLGRAAQSVLQEVTPTGVQVEILDEQMQRVLSTAPLAPRGEKAEMRSVRTHVELGAWIVVSISTGPRRKAIAGLSLVLFLVGLPLFVATAVLSRAIAQRMLRPLRRMAAEAQRASERGVVTPLGRPADPSEVRQLAGAFNMLLSRLDHMLQSERHFTQDAAHELRTPLTVVSGEIEYALSRLAGTDSERIGLERAADQVRAMSELVEALLFLRRSDPVEPAAQTEFVPVNLSDLIRETATDLLRRASERAADLSIVADDEVLVTGHATLLTSAFRNLLGNALKFTLPGQAVRVSVHVQDGDGRFTVEDAGRGISPENRERVFDPFFRDAEARAGHEGFGLGLAILRRVVRAHGGEVEVGDSALGGARFEVRLPGWRPSR